MSQSQPASEAVASIDDDAPPPPSTSATSSESTLLPTPQQHQSPPSDLLYVQYEVEKEHVYLRPIRALISRDLSEPYSIYVYRYFLNQWPDLCFMALDAHSQSLLGVIICKLELHRSGTYRGYIAMLATVSAHRGRGIGTSLARTAIDAMRARAADEVVLETEVTNEASLRLYERLGFLRSKRLHRYYLNGNTAFRLALYLRPGAGLKVPPGFAEGDDVLTVPADDDDDDDGPGGPEMQSAQTTVPAGVV